MTQETSPPPVESRAKKLSRWFGQARQEIQKRSKTLAHQIKTFTQSQWGKRDVYRSKAQGILKKYLNILQDQQKDLAKKLKEKLQTAKIRSQSINLNYLKNLGVQLRSKDQWKLWGTQVGKKIQTFDPQIVLEKTLKYLQKQGDSFSSTLITITISSFFIADLIALFLISYFPEPRFLEKSHFTKQTLAGKTIQDYLNISNRNLFNSRGLIPGEEEKADPTGAAIKTTLPLNLIGVLILKDHSRSIATLEDKSVQLTYPVQVDDEIPKKIRVLEIQARRVTFLNLVSGRNEYVELPDEMKPLAIKAPGVRGGTGIERVAGNQFNIPRSEVDRALSDLNHILTQARAFPNYENGVPAGYKFTEIEKGSIYEKLGLQDEDIITGLNGQPMNDVSKAFEMLNELKTANHMELQVKKGNKTMTYVYDIQ